MNIGSAVKILEAMDPKTLSKLTTAVKKDQKSGAGASGSADNAMAALKEIAKMLGDFQNAASSIGKAAISKAKPSKEDVETQKKQAAKVLENWQASHIKVLEAKIAEAEKHLAQLRSYLATAKQSKPSGWFK